MPNAKERTPPMNTDTSASPRWTRAALKARARELLAKNYWPLVLVAFDGRSILPGWHMNKRSWFSLVLDGSLPLRRIQSLIRRSRDLALRR